MTAKIAIIGAGPSGCFLAQALLKTSPDLTVDIIDGLPVPYGLVRYGVAADHQGTKGVTRQFERVFERQGAHFIGNLTIGRDISLQAVRDAYDIVVLAAGLAGDQRLGIPGEDAVNVATAGELTRALYDHPDANPLPMMGNKVIIMGNGNVSIDLLRLLAKTPEELDGSDLGLRATEWLTAQNIEEITIVGRSAAEFAKFDPVMVKEMARLQGVTISVLDQGETDDPDGQKKLEALNEVNGIATGLKKVIFRFGLTPVQVEKQDTRAVAVEFRNADGAPVTLPCDTFLTAIGFQDAGLLGRNDLINSAQDVEAGVLQAGLYATGWFRRGPRGTIPENRADAKALADRIIADLGGGGGGTDKPGRTVFADIPDLVNYEGWKRIDEAEIAAASAGRVRAKILTRSEMLALAR